MIIKSKRIKARGPALKRALRHIANVEDNDAVELIYGNVADLEDARDDALRFGREYAVRHWILSPGEPISKEQLTELVARLAAEFCFDPKRIVIWRHTKDRATDDGCKEHFHLCVPETDPLTGGVMSSSHDWRRHEKLARTVEVLWGHRVVPGAHAAAVLVALGKEGPTDAENTLCDIAPADHPQSFDERAHQRLKRQGYDLPRMRAMISDALSAATDQADFDARLSIIGLRIRTGDRTDVPIIETAGDGTFVGSLARLTRLRKNALKERMSIQCNRSINSANGLSTKPRIIFSRLSEQMEPVSKAVLDTEGLDQPHPMNIMIELLRQAVEGIEKLHIRLENLAESRLDEGMVKKALKERG